MGGVSHDLPEVGNPSEAQGWAHGVERLKMLCNMIIENDIAVWYQMECAPSPLKWCGARDFTREELAPLITLQENGRKRPRSPSPLVSDGLKKKLAQGDVGATTQQKPVSRKPVGPRTALLQLASDEHFQ
eukprot:12429236-Karenia_brevis.AAC.1